jgi:predicted TIM-barrel fold metal-dependent hydrolase
MLTDRSQLMIDQWRIGLTALAAYSNVHVKLSGLGMFSLGVTQPQLRQVIRDSIQIFGVDRTIYGSNFPLEKLHSSYADLFFGYKKVLSEFHDHEQKKILYENAVKFYRV